MKITSQVRIFPNLIGGLDLADVALMLDQFPQATFLINPAADQILLANAKACELTQRTNEQYQYSSLKSILSNLPVSLNPNEQIPFPCQLIAANGASLTGKGRLLPLPKRNQWLLLLFTPDESSQFQTPKSNGEEKVWQAFRWANFLPPESSPLALLSRSLEDLMALADSENAYLYTAPAHQTHLICTAHKESTPVFPKQLPLKALVEVSVPLMWVEATQPTTQLAQRAKEQGQRFLITLPLGEANARVGLILLCGSEPYQAPLTLEDWTELSRYLTTLIQSSHQIRNLEKELSLLTQENSIHRRLLNSIQEGVILISQEQRVLFMNSAAETILGYTSTEAINQTIQTFLISERDLSAIIQNALHGITRNQFQSLRLYRRSGQSFLADLQLIPLRIEQKVNGLAILIQDRTEQEALIKQSMRMEQRAVLGEFTTLFAHEARNPINNITANLQWMAMNLPPDDPNQVTIQRIQQNCIRLNDLMDTILSYNRISEMEMESIDIKALMKKVLDRQSIHLQQANINLNYETDQSIPFIQGNRRALERVFTNLIDNAIHSMRENGGNLTVKILRSQTVQDQSSWLEISFADSGPGIAEEYKEKLFKESFTTKSNGTGIGLMICNKIMQAHKGTIDYESIPGGTVFVVRLPIPPTTEPSTSHKE